VFEAQAFGAALKMAHHLALVRAMDLSIGLGLMAEKAQHLSAAKVLDPIMHQRRIKPGQSGAAFEHHVSGVSLSLTLQY
jgi:hypothetical protein